MKRKMSVFCLVSVLVIASGAFAGLIDQELPGTTIQGWSFDDYSVNPTVPQVSDIPGNDYGGATLVAPSGIWGKDYAGGGDGGVRTGSDGRVIHSDR